MADSADGESTNRVRNCTFNKLLDNIMVYPITPYLLITENFCVRTTTKQTNKLCNTRAQETKTHERKNYAFPNNAVHMLGRIQL